MGRGEEGNRADGRSRILSDIGDVYMVNKFIVGVGNVKDWWTDYILGLI